MSDPGSGWAILVHGGAKEIVAEEEQANRVGCVAALNAGSRILERGGRAVEAVEAAIRVLESDPTFNAGAGSTPNVQGGLEMDAAIMDGTTLDIGAVAGVRILPHPISTARLLLQEETILLAGEGAEQFAADRNVELRHRSRTEASSGGSTEARHDTVGCVALDASGRLACGTSTGGIEGQWAGRIGDSPLPGCGFYADDRLGAVAASGDGEKIARALFAARIVQALPDRRPDEAIEAALAEVARLNGEAGAITLDRAGRAGWDHNSKHFAVGVARAGGEGPVVYLSKDEERVAENA
jgi:beta-aspartyl-peptidase (threonine type)